MNHYYSFCRTSIKNISRYPHWTQIHAGQIRNKLSSRNEKEAGICINYVF